MERKGKANLEDIARATGVSKMTVSRVLRGGSGFSDETRDRVVRAADALGYVPNRLAIAFGADQASTLVGVCVPRLTSGLFAHVLDGVDRALSRLGYQTMIGSHQHAVEQEEAWVRQVASWRPAGLILSGRHHTAATVDLLRHAGMPVVEIWDLTTSPIDMSVGFNHFDCGVEMGRFLVLRGRRRVGFVGALAGADVMSEARLDGFESALADAGLPLADKEMLLDTPGFYAGYYGIETLLARRRDLDAVYFHNDEMAIGALAWCQANGVRVPDDLGIAGWGGMEAASVLPRRLTTTVVPTTAIGKLAAEALVARLKGEHAEDVTVVPTRLVPGATV
ncbi:LacI family DNA-binding transcriptional regulator [Prosthecomicrobium pneumaticum]|uniref:LacI family gluconate utilization system Gnt-I transcriptional repressor n=1 Tax=Prosthecomicrobium pneumaticum TaxID=81895 RepID=A0A7W9CSH3_9HYPH|nr:LacI family DNA-binding transcriptional regulator [Prosthecomicrobium pneumaticum]MBB5750982.1 LacI family gluconate utilization system Gnt-I transcriptional repressor [Prosthecomicrobium pneumaticum]